MTAALEGGEWSVARPGHTLPPGMEPLLILQEAGWSPARSQSLYRLSYPVHTHTHTNKPIYMHICIYLFIHIYVYIYIYIYSLFLTHTYTHTHTHKCRCYPTWKSEVEY